MAKRKETRILTCAFRDRTAGTITEFKLHDYDGEVDDVASIISAMHDVVSMTGETIETKHQTCLNLILEPNVEGQTPFLCSKLEIAVSAEKIEEKEVKKSRV